MCLLFIPLIHFLTRIHLTYTSSIYLSISFTITIANPLHARKPPTISIIFKWLLPVIGILHLILSAPLYLITTIYIYIYILTYIYAQSLIVYYHYYSGNFRSVQPMPDKNELFYRTHHPTPPHYILHRTIFLTLPLIYIYIYIYLLPHLAKLFIYM